MADSFNIDSINLYIEENSQVDSTATKQQVEESQGYREAVEKRRQELDKALSKTLTDAVQRAAEIDKQLAKERSALQQQLDEEANKNLVKKLQEAMDDAATVEAREQAKRELAIAQSLNSALSSLISGVNNFLNSNFNNIKQASFEYSDYVERIEVALLGSSRNYDSVADKLEKVFATNVFFSLKDTIDKAAELVEKGIAYNVESRAAMAVFSDKIAKTFDAFDSNLLRLVRIQQQDSTQARLGMENILLKYLNSNFQDSEYLHGLSDQVTSALLEAESLRSRDEAVEFEYAVQKYLGSFSSVGVSDTVVQSLAQAIGYLGSGDVQSLTSNSQLQQLLALSISRSGSQRSYGDMLLSPIDTSDITAIFQGFYNLVEEIGNSDNQVALNQYAKIFGMSVSDITSVLNLSAEQIKKISTDLIQYNTAFSQVSSELSVGNLMQRTSYAEMYKNFKSNILSAIGLDMADNLAANLIYEALDQAAGVVDMFNLGIEVDPFGVGASTKIDAGALIRGTTAMTTYMAAYAKNIQSLSSMLSPNLGLLDDESGKSMVKMEGGGLNQTISGTTTNQTTTAVANTETSAVYATTNSQAKAASSEIMNKDLDKEEERMQKTQKAMEKIGDNVAFIVQLLNDYGIKVRQLPGSRETGTASFMGGAELLSNGGY